MEFQAHHLLQRVSLVRKMWWSKKSIHKGKHWCAVGLVLLLHYILKVAWALNSDGEALLSFKSAISSDPRSILQGWKESDRNPCNWTGILCMTVKDAGELRVVSINLPRKQLSGAIVAEIGNLSYLQHINLHTNQLSGPLPREIFNATLLRVVYLFDNRLSGSFPAEIGDLAALEYLDVGYNRLVGSIPASISNCAQLVKLILKNNLLEGKIPSGLGSNLISLQELDLSSNLLEGSIPDDLGNLSSLRGTLNLSCNHLSGVIPDSLGKLPFNVSLDLRSNNLTGPIPLDGALSNQGPTAFLGNSGLCGLPLANTCPTESPPFPNLPTLGPLPQKPPSPPVWLQAMNQKGSLSSRTIAAVAIGDTFGIALMGLIFLYCYWRNSSCKSKNSSSSEKLKSGCCCGRLAEEFEAISENSEQGELVHFENDPEYDLEDLLKASAYVLGKRGSGIVYKAVLDSGLIVVVRRLGEGGMRRHKEFEAEARLIGRIRHPNIVRLLAYYWSMEEKLLVYEFINNGSLAAALHGKSTSYCSPEPLPWLARLKIAKGVANGLAYLHEFSPRKYIHGDIKPTNILVDSKMDAYIADFGLSQLCNMSNVQELSQIVDIGIKHPRPSTEGGRQAFNFQSKKQSGEILQSGKQSGEIVGSNNLSQPFQPPEALSNCKPTQKWDVYAFGVVLLELLTGIQSGKEFIELHHSDLVTWVQTAWEDKKSLSDFLDPDLLQAVHSEDEMLEVLQIALCCVVASPEPRPKMKHVAESLDKIGSSS